MKETNPPGNKRETERYKKRQKERHFLLVYTMFGPLNDYNGCWDCKVLPLFLLCFTGCLYNDVA